jgi:drug/metabolite transporter (DMT)-like permease
MTVFNGFTSSCEVVFSKNVSTKYSSLQVTLMVFLAIGVTHSAVSFLLGEHQDITLLTTAGGSLLLFCLAAIAGVIALYAGYRDLDPSIGALVGLTEIIFSVVFGMIFFQEVLNGNTIFGGLLILTAAALPNMYELWQARKGKKPIPLAA